MKFLLSVVIALCVLPQVFGQASKNRHDRLEELAAAERAFAAFTAKEGFRDGFIKFFADDGIGFGPHPERTRETLMKSQRPTGPPTLLFNWTPMFGDISFAGDMGYTTGPVLFTDVSANPKPPRHGIYFSVWQKQADGSWKVAIDMGVDTPAAVAPIGTAFAAAKREKRVAVTKDPEDWLLLDRSFSDAIARAGMAKAYAGRLGRQFRIHRKGRMPVTDENELIPLLLSADHLEFIDGKVSSSNDMAFTYGKYSGANKAIEVEMGYYVHVWRRDGEGVWRLVVDVQNPLGSK